MDDYTGAKLEDSHLEALASEAAGAIGLSKRGKEVNEAPINRLSRLMYGISEGLPLDKRLQRKLLFAFWPSEEERNGKGYDDIKNKARNVAQELEDYKSLGSYGRTKLANWCVTLGICASNHYAP